MQRNNLEFYDLNANKWWQPDAKIYALYHLNKPRFDFFDRYSDWQGLKVLDVGCGGGFSCEFMAQKGAIVFGIDRSGKCITKAQEHANCSNLPIEYKYGFAEELPYPNNTFDVVICVDVLEHITDLPKVIAEIHRVLKPRGLFLFDTINKTWKSKFVMLWLLEDILHEIPQGIHDWQKFIQPKELTQLLHINDFSKIEIKGFNLFGETFYDNILAYIYYKKTGGFRAKITNNTSLMYIGKAVKN